MKDRRTGIIEMLIYRDSDIFFLDLTLAWPKISLCTRKIERSKSKSNCEELDFRRKCRGKSYEKITK